MTCSAPSARRPRLLSNPRWFWVALFVLVTLPVGCGDDDSSTDSGIVVSVEPATATVEVSQSQQFSAVVTGSSNVAVTWTVQGDSLNGKIDAAGLFSAPPTVPDSATVTVKATSQANPYVHGTALVTITPPPTPVGFVRIEPGTFVMGSPTTETGRAADETQHWVQVTRPFLMGETEVTEAQWQEIMGALPSSYNYGPRFPVLATTWFNAVEYCNALSDSEGLTRAYTINGSRVTWDRDADGYRLPTESEWEYACRAGTTTQYWSGQTDADLARAAWYVDNSENQPHEVKGKQANPWGMYDTLGNAWEWCWDWWHATYPAGTESEPAVDPAGAASAQFRVVRGGGWYFIKFFHRCANRGVNTPTYDPNYYSVGFRVARTLAR